MHLPQLRFWKIKMEFSHFDPDGNAVMVDVTGKAETIREACAQGDIGVSRECFEKIRQGSMEKGNVLSVARIAGIMGAKRTSDLIPLCHVLNLTKVAIDFELMGEMEALKTETQEEKKHWVRVRCTVRCAGKTGVEMEALTGTSVALLTIYDMCKAVDKSMEITGICLISKTGGKSGEYRRELR